MKILVVIIVCFSFCSLAQETPVDSANKAPTTKDYTDKNYVFLHLSNIFGGIELEYARKMGERSVGFISVGAFDNYVFGFDNYIVGGELCMPLLFCESGYLFRMGTKWHINYGTKRRGKRISRIFMSPQFIYKRGEIDNVWVHTGRDIYETWVLTDDIVHIYELAVVIGKSIACKHFTFEMYYGPSLRYYKALFTEYVKMTHEGIVEGFKENSYTEEATIPWLRAGIKIGISW